MSLKLVSGSSSARRSSLAVTNVALRVIIAWLWALTAVSRATLTSRSVSMSPSAVLGTAMTVPASTWRAACSASMVSLLPAARRSALRGGRLTSMSAAVAAQESRQPDPVGTGALNTERHDTALAVGPRQKVGVAVVGRWDEQLVEATAEPVDGHGDVLVFVRVDTDDDIGALKGDAGHGC